jgi:Mg2+ and Co2+ transporter CorA
MQSNIGVHGKKFCLNAVGNARQLPATGDNQKAFPLAFGVHNAPVDAPANVLRLIESEAQALAVSIAAKHHKLDYIAACIGKSRSYVSRLQSGERPIPDKLVGPLCAATGSNLLRQYRNLQAALGEVCEVQRLADMLRAAA